MGDPIDRLLNSHTHLVTVFIYFFIARRHVRVNDFTIFKLALKVCSSEVDAPNAAFALSSESEETSD